MLSTVELIFYKIKLCFYFTFSINGCIFFLYKHKIHMKMIKGLNTRKESKLFRIFADIMSHGNGAHIQNIRR